MVSRRGGDPKKLTDVTAAITGFIGDAHYCQRKKIVCMCACVSACESVGGGGGGAVFYSGFVEEKIDPHGKQVPGQRKQPSHVRTRVPILPVTVRSTLSTFSPIVGRPPESFKAGVVGGARGREGNACCITPPDDFLSQIHRCPPEESSRPLSSPLADGTNPG